MSKLYGVVGRENNVRGFGSTGQELEEYGQ